jgi:phosphohistidine swiveling domain-containing protein
MRDFLSIFRRVKFTNKLSQTREQLQKKYHCFQKMLSETNDVRVIMADMEEKLLGDYLFDMHYIRSNLNILSNKMPIIIGALNEISSETNMSNPPLPPFSKGGEGGFPGGKYSELYNVLKRADSEIQAILTKKREIGSITKGMVNPVRKGGEEVELSNGVNMAGVKDANLGKVMSPAPIKGYKVLINSGVIACKGVGTGNAYLMNREEDLDNFPDRAILIARHISPKFVTVMNKTTAIVTDAGSATEYMASLARDFKVPTILNTKIATKLITSGMEITVDAINGNVYEGRVDEVIELGQKKENLFKNTHVFKILEEALKKIVPLNLIYLRVDSFKPELCKTFHDITHFVNEVALDEMFKISNRPDVKEGEAVRLVLKIPLKIYMIDLNGGIETAAKRITANNICSIPMNAFLKGMMSMKWPGPKPKNVTGFASVVAHIAIEPSLYRDRGWGKSYALISREYMNFSIRLGYHLSTVEAYAGDNIDHNYIRFHFKGGGASIERRLRRTQLIKEILKKLDFEVDRIGDMLNARITRYQRSTIEEKLSILGRLTIYTKQLDMIMFSDAFVDCYLQEFMREYCSIEAKLL